MRFAVAHKTVTYLMVGFAYLAMIVGGGVAPPIAFGGLFLFVASWWWEPPRIRFETWGWVWTVLSILALAYSILTGILTGDYLGVGATFLVWLVVTKAFNRRAARDWQQLYLLSFLMLVAGSVLNADLTYGLCFLGYVITSTWALTLFHLRREMEDNLLVKHAADRASERVEVKRILDSKRIVGTRFFVGTGALSFGIFLLSAAAFLALPRVGIGFFLKGRGGLTLAGFSDGVKLGGHGVIKNDSTIVMRVEMASQHGNREAPYIHWRGVAFDAYSKGQWSRTNAAPRTQVNPTDTIPGRDRYYTEWRDTIPAADGDDLDKKWIRQDIWLEPLDSDVLFAATRPLAYEYTHTLRPRTPPREKNDEIRLEHGQTVHYTVWSDLRNPTAAKLRSADPTLPGDLGVYLQLPPEITPRTRELAQAITAGLPTEYDKVAAISTWLDTNLTYTLELADPGDQEPVDFFLFDRKKGHCEYFASAFAVLARAAGIPTRQVNGFLGGEWNEYQGYVAVRAGDAHSWDEVYFPGVGWAMFDATPAADIDEMGRGGSGWRARLSRMIDTLRFQWTKWVIEYDLISQLALFRSIGGAFKDGAVAIKHAIVAFKDLALRHYVISLAVIAAITALILRRRRRAPALEATARARRRQRSTVAEVYDRVMKQFGKAGVLRDVATTPRELAAALVKTGHRAAPQLHELTELYYAAEWGARRDPAAQDIARAAALAEEIRAALSARA